MEKGIIYLIAVSNYKPGNNMEVYHHLHLPHGKNLSVGQAGKNFKEYFFEFLMIFLSVTMGFKTLVEKESIS